MCTFFILTFKISAQYNLPKNNCKTPQVLEFLEPDITNSKNISETLTQWRIQNNSKFPYELSEDGILNCIKNYNQKIKKINDDVLQNVDKFYNQLVELYASYYGLIQAKKDLDSLNLINDRLK